VSPRQQPEQQAPPVQRLRIRYAKRGRLRFTSHRDFSRAFERALVRARLPMAYSSGFNPHPRISYAGAAPTGSASEAEYLEIGLAERVDPAAAQAALDRALPDGLDVVTVVESEGGGLADLLEASHWVVDLPQTPAAEARRAVGEFLASESVVVERMTKKGMRELDARSPVVALTVTEHEGGCRLDLVLRHAVPAVRPDDVLSGLRSAGLDPGPAPLLTRLSQGPLLEDATVGDPLGGSR
jgi:radical SAM-linked protein